MTAKVIRQVIIDFICLAVAWLPVLLLDLLGKPYVRGFYCDDTSIRYPYKDNTVTTTVLYCYGLGIPIVLMIIVEIFRHRNRSDPKRLPRYDSASSLQVSRFRIPSGVVEFLHVLAIFLFGAACSQLTTDISKYTVGRLRPHFLDVCKPENFSELCPVNGPPTYITDYTCTQKDEFKLKDSRLSFPSGHASFSAYTMLFVVFYLQSRMTWSGSKFLRPTIQIAVLLLAWFTGLSRVADHKHHWSDVLSGFLIGTIAASLTALHVSALFKSKSTKDALLPQTVGEMELRNSSAASANK